MLQLRAKRFSLSVFSLGLQIATFLKSVGLSTFSSHAGDGEGVLLHLFHEIAKQQAAQWETCWATNGNGPAAVRADFVSGVFWCYFSNFFLFLWLGGHNNTCAWLMDVK